MPTYPITFIDKTVLRENLSLTNKQTVAESSFTYKSQVIHGGSRWTLEWAWPRMKHAEAERVSGWIASLRGQVGSFRYWPRQSVTSALTGHTLALPGYGQNSVVRVSGWGQGQATTLRIGQYFQIGDQLLKIIAAPVIAAASGTADIEFEPALRKSYVAGTAINFVSPSAIFRLATSEGAGFTLDPDRAPEFPSMSALEVI